MRARRINKYQIDKINIKIEKIELLQDIIDFDYEKVIKIVETVKSIFKKDKLDFFYKNILMNQLIKYQ